MKQRTCSKVVSLARNSTQVLYALHVLRQAGGCSEAWDRTSVSRLQEDSSDVVGCQCTEVQSPACASILVWSLHVCKSHTQTVLSSEADANLVSPGAHAKSRIPPSG